MSRVKPPGSLMRRILLVLLPCVLPATGLLVSWSAAQHLAAAQQLSDQEANDSAKRALRNFPWYDAQSDRPRRIDVEPPADFKNRHSRWEFQPPNVSWPPWLTNTLQVLLWILLAAVLLVVVYFLVRAFVAYEGGGAQDEIRSAAITAGHANRVESLPFQVKRPLANFLEEARRHYEAGRFGEAIIYLYSYQLVELDKHQLIRLAKGKTNRQYLREARRRSGLSGLLERTMVAFEDVFFGDQTLERHRFESCWQELDQFHQQLAEVQV